MFKKSNENKQKVNENPHLKYAYLCRYSEQKKTTGLIYKDQFDSQNSI